MSSRNRSDRKASAMLFEALELRQLLSASIPTFHPDLTITPAAQSAGFTGYSPAEIRRAYGFDLVSADGAGQTIAIVDAYNNPSIAADLHAFDVKYGLADPSLKVVSQNGGSANSVRNDAGWSTEIALDVEWAHAIAPGANILLVEAYSATLNNLMAAVNYARNAADVSVVSMSWGGGEFWSETYYDHYFTTPAGHQGVTFVTASGDSGSWWGPEWPSSSPNVLSVGGTSLLTGNSSGAYSAEYGWNGSGGGISTYEAQPTYQDNAQSTGARTTPDVALNADPYTGFSMYTSVRYQGYSGWSVVGGTTLPTLYSLYSGSTYSSSFHDVASGRSSWFFGAHTGYDAVTGLGTPKAAELIGTLSGTPPTAAPPSLASRKVRLSRHAIVLRPVVTQAPVSVTAAPAPVVAPVAPVAMAAAPTHVSRPQIALAVPDVGYMPGSTAPVAASFGFSSPSSFASFYEAPASQATGRLAAAPFAQLLPNAIVHLAETVAAPNAASTLVSNVSDVAINVTAAAQSLAIALPKLGSLNAMMAFADAIASFAHESAAIGSVVAITENHALAWTITFGVLAADSVLIGYYRAKRNAKRRADQAQTENPDFSLRRIGS